jgi:hypothetical protein
MARKLRTDIEGGLYHLIARSHEGTIDRTYFMQQSPNRSRLP